MNHRITICLNIQNGIDLRHQPSRSKKDHNNYKTSSEHQVSNKTPIPRKPKQMISNILHAAFWTEQSRLKQKLHHWQSK